MQIAYTSVTPTAEYEAVMADLIPRDVLDASDRGADRKLEVVKCPGGHWGLVVDRQVLYHIQADSKWFMQREHFDYDRASQGGCVMHDEGTLVHKHGMIYQLLQAFNVAFGRFQGVVNNCQNWTRGAVKHLTGRESALWTTTEKVAVTTTVVTVAVATSAAVWSSLTSDTDTLNHKAAPAAASSSNSGSGVERGRIEKAKDPEPAPALARDGADGEDVAHLVERGSNSQPEARANTASRKHGRSPEPLNAADHKEPSTKRHRSSPNRGIDVVEVNRPNVIASVKPSPAA